ncbi:MAG: diaminopimelate decarboxylase [Clostridia bacterium]|nr:diaminopimelate decarboxylase [Clostridia bacterium]
MICDNLSVSSRGHLLFGGHDTVELIRQYGSPLYVMDEEKIRRNARIYVDSMKQYFGNGSHPLFASKAASFKQIYRIIGQEGMGTDVVSAGEIYTAKAAGFDMSLAYFHGNNKTDADIAYAMENGVGCIVADNAEELEAIERLAGERGIRQKILLRLTPGIDPHTYEAVATGKVDSKFGAAIETGAAEELTLLALSKSNLDLWGFHCHVGSQVFDSEVYLAASEIMLSFVAKMQKDHGLVTRELNLGGGYGVRYTEADPVINIAENIALVAAELKKTAARLGIALPCILMEPGRSIVADAGLTLYTVGSVKEIKGYKNYVSVDGGMPDNPRYALYGSAYTVEIANKMDESKEFVCSVVGRCCECGDILQENVKLTSTVTRGDILAVLTTGAYNYSMASNYNRIPRLPIIMVTKDSSYVAVKRETFEDLIKNEI